MKRSAYNWQYQDCLYRIEEWRNAPKGICPYTVYMLSSKSGTGPGAFIGYFMTKTEAEDAIIKSTIKSMKTNFNGGMILP